MCGICGFISLNQQKGKTDLMRMSSSISHRGPDSEGFYLNDKIGMGHRRLTIIDVSDASNQPFYSACGNYVIVFNGEIYNYRELYNKLKISPKTTGDTEVILELFVQYGPSFVSMLNGMFAFVILDIRKNNLHIFRDRLGVKPLFYSLDDNNFVFGSEIKAILAYDKIAFSEIHRETITDFLHLGFIPEPDTIYRKIKKFPSGCYATVDENAKIAFFNYWDLKNKILPSTIKNEAEAKKELKSLLISSVGYRMISDVPLGTFLSGGIDSSLVTAVAQSLSDTPINTFSIGFHESAYNESGFAKKIAKHLGTKHHELMISEQDAIEHLLEIMDSFDEPFIDTSALPVYLVSKMASKHVKVVLTGDGGDELFLGYGSYQWAERISKPHIKLFKKIFYHLLKVYPDNRFKAKAEMFNGPGDNAQSHIFSQEQFLFTIKEIHKYFNLPERKIDFNIDFKNILRQLDPSEQQSLFDIAYYLKDDLLTKVDRMTMYNSVEGREPLLDYRLVEFAVNLDPALKMNDGTNKYLLKQVLYDYVPATYFNRPKWGFSIPLKKWLSDKLHFLIEEYLSVKVIKEVGIVDIAYVQSLLVRFERGEDYSYHKIWQLIILHRFLNMNKGSIV